MDVYKGKCSIKIIPDVVTRWWSTFTIMERLLHLKPALEAMKLDNRIPIQYCLFEKEWETVKIVVSILQPFKAAQKHLEGENMSLCLLFHQC